MRLYERIVLAKSIVAGRSPLPVKKTIVSADGLRRIMLLRALLTTAFVAVGTAAVLIVDCTTTIIDLFDDDLMTVCESVVLLGRDSELGAGAGLAAFALLGLVAIWFPVLRSRVRQRRFEAVKTLAENLPRLAEVGTHLAEVEDVPTLAEIARARLVKRVEEVEASIMSEAVPTREATQQWMGLLRQANDLHNDGTLDTADFKKINTRLIDLLSAPHDDAGKPPEVSSR